MSVRIKSNERGAALLFAMGLLALFLLLAMAFAANSLLQRKIAANRSSRAMVEVIADSAVERVRTQLFYYQADVAPAWIDGKADINRLKSFVDTADAVDAEFNGGGVTSDLLEIEKLGGVLYEEKDFQQCPYVISNTAHVVADCLICHNWELPDWRLVKNHQAAAQKEIVGRYAYIMLPPIPRFFQEHKPNGLPTWRTFEELATSTDVTTKGDLLNFKREMEIYYPPALEAYVYNSTDLNMPSEKIPPRSLPADYYKRFDLKRADWGTITPENLLDTAPASFYKDVVDKKLTSDSYSTKNELLVNPATTDGIQFLRRVSNAPKTFTSIADRRLQIAANLIDYCDGDNIPTTASDAKPDTWDSTTKPVVNYAGNERTPYIDRIGVVVRAEAMRAPLPSWYIGSTSGAQDFLDSISTQGAAYPGAMQLTLNARVTAALVNIYSEPAKRNYALQLFLNGDGFYFENMRWATPEVTFQYSYEDAMGTSIPVTETITLTDNLWLQNAGTVLNSKLRFGNTADPDGSEGKIILPFNEVEFTQGYEGSKSDNMSIDGAMKAMTIELYIPVLSTISQDLALLSHIDDGSFVKDSLTWTLTDTSSLPVSVQATKFNISRMVLSDLDDDSWGDGYNADAGVSVANVDYVKEFDVGYVNYTFDAITPTFFALGGIMCKDPRQNLNEDDWYPETKNNGPIFDTDIAKQLGYEENWLFSTEAKTLVDPLCDNSTYNLRNPRNNGASPDMTRDIEDAKTPAWLGDDADKHLSTAFFRNGPMESLAELGFIHRGAMWETLNLANAAQPHATATNLSKPVQPSDYDPVKYKYTQEQDTEPGTSYQQGDGGLLDQVKVTDKNWQYDVYDLNLRDGNNTYSPTKFLGDNYYRYLLEDIRIGALQSSSPTIDLLTSDSDGTKVTDFTDGTTTTVVANSLISFLNWRFETDETKAPPQYSNRSQLLWYYEDKLSANEEIRYYNAYNELTDAVISPLKLNKALYDELCAKTMQMTTAGGLPTVYRVLVLAQSIRDIGADSSDPADAFKISIDRNGDGQITGDADPIKNEKDILVLLGRYEEGVDEITGQLRMIVTFVRDPVTCRVLIKDIEYLEE